MSMVYPGTMNGGCLGSAQVQWICTEAYCEEEESLEEGEDVEGKVPAVWMPVLPDEVIHASLA